MFDFMITPWIIRILYWVTQIFVLIFGLAAIITGDHDFRITREIDAEVTGILVLVVGSLALRLFFEMSMVRFKIFENTKQIRRILKNEE
jgi:hypothetical protein